MPTGCFVSAGRSIDGAVERVKLAESLGYDAAYMTHIAGRDSMIVSAIYAAATERIKIGTGVVPIYSRTPATMAQETASIADVSGGRFNARDRRLPPAGRRVLARADDRQAGHRDARVRLDRARDPARRGAARGREVAERFCAPGRRPVPRHADPLRRALAEHAAARRRDRRRRRAVALQPQLHPRRRRPDGPRGSREGGQDDRGLRHRPRRPVGCTDDVGAAYDAMRQDLLPYFGLPFYRAMLERSGFEADIAAYDAAGRRRRAR